MKEVDAGHLEVNMLQLGPLGYKMALLLPSKSQPAGTIRVFDLLDKDGKPTDDPHKLIVYRTGSWDHFLHRGSNVEQDVIDLNTAFNTDIIGLRRTQADGRWHQIVPTIDRIPTGPKGVEYPDQIYRSSLEHKDVLA